MGTARAGSPPMPCIRPQPSVGVGSRAASRGVEVTTHASHRVGGAGAEQHCKIKTRCFQGGEEQVLKEVFKGAVHVCDFQEHIMKSHYMGKSNQSNLGPSALC